MITTFIGNAENKTSLADVLLKGCPEGYMGQRADNSKAKNGTGILKVSNGIYVGDLSRNQFSGKGMLICDEKAKISNAPEAFVYIGGWLKGKKQGRGKCYNLSGDLIYDGTFENDKPKETYPTPDANIHLYYSMMQMSDGYYIGEIVDGSPNGFGLYAHETEGIWIGGTKDGFRNGRGIILYSPDIWAIGNFKNGNLNITSTSDTQAQRNSIIKEVNSQIKSDFVNGMAEVASGLVSVASDFAATKTGSTTINSPSFESSVAGSYATETVKKSSRNKSSGNQTDTTKYARKGADCGTTWRSDSRVYDHYDSDLVRLGDKMTEDERKFAKQKMREIRLKWESRGCPITKSPREDD